MSRLLAMLSKRVTDDPVAILYHYACGHMVDYDGPAGGPTRWTSTTHRGVQWLHKVEFPRKQKRYIFAPQFQVRWDTAFEEVVRTCGEKALEHHGHTWVTEPLVRGLVRLHDMGYAHSFEAWQDGKLVGGAFGIQLGSMMSCDSMFHRVSNASKAAYGQTLVRLQERGFTLVDTNGVAAHQVNYGEEWMPRWAFDRVLDQMMRLGAAAPTLVDGRPYPARLPAAARGLAPLLKAARPLLRRLNRPSPKPSATVPADATPAPTPDAQPNPAAAATPVDPARPAA